MNRRLIIENRTDVPVVKLLAYITQIIDMGRISNDNKQYCYATRFKDGIVIFTDLNKRSDRFVITQDPVQPLVADQANPMRQTGIETVP